MSDKLLQIIVFIALVTSPLWLGKVLFDPDRSSYTQEEMR